MRLLLAALLLSFTLPGQNSCNLSTRAFSSGEVLRYRVNYNWGPVWLESAWAQFSVSEVVNENGKPCFYLKGEGSTHKNYDWFFKVRDLFETWMDTTTLRPSKFSASMNEGGKSEKHLYIFDDRKKMAYTVIMRGRKKPVVDTIKQGNCTIDVLSAIYHARSYDYSKCRVNDTISMSQLIDGKVYSIYVRYLGRDTYKTDKHGSFQCIKFSPLLVEGSIFRKGEGMTVWVTDDANKLPLFIETPIVVGSIKVYLDQFSGLRYPLNSRIR